MSPPTTSNSRQLPQHHGNSNCLTENSSTALYYL
jgi:hypothetical protein